MTKESDELLTTIDATKPIVEREIIQSLCRGERLDKNKGNWAEWCCDVQTFLTMIGLGGQLLNDISTAAPSAKLQPNAHQNYIANDQTVSSFLKSAVAKI